MSASCHALMRYAMPRKPQTQALSWLEMYRRQKSCYLRCSAEVNDINAAHFTRSDVQGRIEYNCGSDHVKICEAVDETSEQGHDQVEPVR
jgi:hypothetical protein